MDREHGSLRGRAPLPNIQRQQLQMVYVNISIHAFVNKSDILFFNQSWIADINHTYTSLAIPIQNSGVIGLSLNVMNYGDIEVTTLEFQDGVGEYYTALDYSAGISYARKFVEWFGFGATFAVIPGAARPAVATSNARPCLRCSSINACFRPKCDISHC